MIQFQPELPGIRLRFCIGTPVIADMFVLAGNLATVATIAMGNIMNKDFHL
jgi:hypothetical protein